MKIAILDYGMGNLASVTRALQTLGHTPLIVERPEALGQDVGHLILPGVGAFGEAMDRLRSSGWIDALDAFLAGGRNRLLGICLGMQLLAAIGMEHGDHAGLGLIDGRVVHLRDLGVADRIPHVGWNAINIEQHDMLLDGIPDGTDFYFVHSFAFVVDDPAHQLATANYGTVVPAVVRSGSVWGTQFHPEKSSKAGMRILRNFIDGAAC